MTNVFINFGACLRAQKE